MLFSRDVNANESSLMVILLIVTFKSIKVKKGKASSLDIAPLTTAALYNLGSGS